MKKNWLEVQHCGGKAYAKATAGYEAHEKWIEAVLRAALSEERLSIERTDCTVQTDWIEQIEAALPYLEKAVAENRQFIYRQGEVVPIEKVRRVSRASVEHLSRHSELFAAQPKEHEELLPEKLYVTQNEDTYSVYENRFLYTLLCSVRDFVTYRYRKILEITAAFSSDVALRKEFSDDSRTVRFALEYNECTKGNGSVYDSAAAESLKRILAIQQAVEMLLHSALMKEVAAEPPLQPPFVRTNVLTHDPNFKIAFDLYLFLADYTADGFEKTEQHCNTSQITDDMRADFAELIAATSYVTHLNSGMRELLDERFLAEEAQKQREAEQAYKERLAALKARLGTVDEHVQAYILTLEQHAEAQENQCTTLTNQLKDAEQALQACKAVITASNELRAQLETAQKAQNEAEHKLLQAMEREKKAMREAERQVAAERAQQEALAEQHAAELKQQRAEFEKAYETLSEKYTLANAKANAAAVQQAELSVDGVPVTHAAFAQLEAEYRAYRQYYRAVWKEAKKQIRKTQLSDKRK